MTNHYTLQYTPYDDIDSEYEFTQNYDTYAIYHQPKHGHKERIGYIQFTQNDHILYVHMLDIHVSRKGHATNLLHYMTDLFHIKIITGFCLASHEAISFWQSMGATIPFLQLKSYTKERLIAEKIDAPFLIHTHHYTPCAYNIRIHVMANNQDLARDECRTLFDEIGLLYEEQPSDDAIHVAFVPTPDHMTEDTASLENMYQVECILHAEEALYPILKEKINGYVEKIQVPTDEGVN